MRWLIVLLLVSVALAASEKKPEKRPAKKAHSQKPTKAPKSILDEFTALPPSDVDFIKELDRQFAEHGNKIRIKVERSNGTDGKNIKRTIDGDLGYGHYSNQDEAGYHFSKPKYMIYPYSQHDIPPARATHSTAETVTDIEITPSHSYELKPIEEVYQVYPTQQYSQEQQQQYYHQQAQSQHQPKQLYQQEEAPVIVLKIPGPSKYAAHLQALLQQYLEIRAAQLYKELEEHEYQQQQQQQQQYHQQQQHAHHYAQEEQQVPQHHHHHHHQQQEQHHQQEQPQHEHHTKTKYSQPDPVYPTEIAYVPMIRTSHNTYVPLPEQYYEAPKASARPTKHPANYRKTTVTPTHISFHSTAQPEPAYHYQTYHAETEQQHHGHDSQGHTQIQYQYVPVQQPSTHEEEHETHQYVYEKPAINFVTPVPDETHHSHPDPYQHHHQQQQHQQPPKKYPNFAEYHHHHRPQQQQEEDYLPEPKLVENYPSHKHTRVVYKSPSLKAELQQEVSPPQHHDHDHYHHAQLEQQEAAQFVHQHHPQQQQQQQHQQQYILQEVYPSQGSYFEDKSFVESVEPQATTDATETAVSAHYNTEPVVTITQRPKQRYNYHAHSSGHHGGSRGSRMAAANGSTARPRMSSSKASSKRDAIASPTAGPYTEEEFRKVNKMVQRMKKKSRTTIDPASVTVSSVASGSTSPSPSA